MLSDNSDDGEEENISGRGSRRRIISHSHANNNSVSCLKNVFFSNLPDKVRSGLDPKTPLLFDLSKTHGLMEGEREYYERQFSTLRSFEEVDGLESPGESPASDTEAQDRDQEQEQARHETAINVSNWANVFLLVFKVSLMPFIAVVILCSFFFSVSEKSLPAPAPEQIYATVRSGSLAIAASTLDSLLDLMAGGILWFTHMSMKSINIYKYPIGKLRVQPVGIIIFAAVMATLGFQVLVEAVERLIQNQGSDKMSSDQFLWLTLIMLMATAVKLLLWFYCRTSTSKIVRAYAKDYYFDVVTNVIGLIAAVLGDKFFWWIDQIGAIVLAVYTIVNWSGTVLENAVSLVGQSAPPEMLQKLTYLVLRHHPQIKRVDTVRAYTFGVLYFVEVDIELPEDLPLKEAHAVGETLQIKIEKLGEVERAFVHLDFECDHKPEHSVLHRLPSAQP